MSSNVMLDDAVVLPQPLTIRNAEAIRELLLSQLQVRQNVVVELDSDADLSVIQVLESARLYAGERDASLTLSSPVSDQTLATLRRAGFLTGRDPASNQFWLHRKEMQ